MTANHILSHLRLINAVLFHIHHVLTTIYFYRPLFLTGWCWLWKRRALEKEWNSCSQNQKISSGELFLQLTMKYALRFRGCVWKTKSGHMQDTKSSFPEYHFHKIRSLLNIDWFLMFIIESRKSHFWFVWDDDSLFSWDVHFVIKYSFGDLQLLYDTMQMFCYWATFYVEALKG